MKLFVRQANKQEEFHVHFEELQLYLACLELRCQFEYLIVRIIEHWPITFINGTVALSSDQNEPVIH